MAFFDAARRDFSSLSLKDLLDARDTYHIHLAQRANVFATAIGRFYIRNKDADAKTPSRVRGQNRSPAERSRIRPSRAGPGPACSSSCRSG